MTPLEEFKSFLRRNAGKLKLTTLDQSIDILERYMSDLIANPVERKHIQKLMQEAYSLDAPTLRAHMERGKMRPQTFEDDFEELIPKEGLLREYVEYTRDTESPTAYHFFSFLTVIGALLGRSLYVDQQVYRIWPNMVTLLVGPSGRLRKTTAAELAMKVGQNEALLFASGDPRLDVLAEKTTSEAIHTMLAQKNPAIGLLYAPEMSTVINKKEYNKSLINDLTRLWDCPDRLAVRTQSRGPETLFNVALSALFCSNEEWLVESIPEDAFKGGFFSRMVTVYVGAPSQLIPRPQRLDDELREKILYGLTETARCAGSAPLTRAAEKFFDKRYREILSHIPQDVRMGPWFSRVPDHILRIGMLLSVAEQRTGTVYIDEKHLREADAIVSWVSKYLPKVYALMGVSDVGDEARRVIHAVFKNGGRLSRSKLMGQLYGKMTSNQLDERIRTLKQAGIIAQTEGGLFDEGGTTVYYKLLKNPEDI